MLHLFSPLAFEVYALKFVIVNAFHKFFDLILRMFSAAALPIARTAFLTQCLYSVPPTQPKPISSTYFTLKILASLRLERRVLCS